MNAFFSTFVQRFIFVVFIWCISFGFNYVATENGSVQYPRSEASDTIVNHELINAETTPQAPDASIDMETFRSSATNKGKPFSFSLQVMEYMGERFDYIQFHDWSGH